MEQKLINQFEDDLNCWKSRENKLKEFKKHLVEFDLPSEIENQINFEISSEIDLCETEIQQISIDLNLNDLSYEEILEIDEDKIDEEIEAKCDLARKDINTIFED